MRPDDISLHLLVKDEEELLPELMRLVGIHVGEVIVVDTGSIDRTIAIAKYYTTKILSVDLDKDFAAARNKGLELVTKPWVLWLDADERPNGSMLNWIQRWEPPKAVQGVSYGRMAR